MNLPTRRVAGIRRTLTKGQRGRIIAESLVDGRSVPLSRLRGSDLPADTMPAMNKLAPFLWFNDNAEEAAEFYLSIFPHARKLDDMMGMIKMDLPALEAAAREN
jgi:hypothetical protein